MHNVLDNGYSCGVLKKLLSSDNHRFFCITLLGVLVSGTFDFFHHVKGISCEVLSFFLSRQKHCFLQSFVIFFVVSKELSLAKLY
jgi:hypothetical protein